MIEEKENIFDEKVKELFLLSKNIENIYRDKYNIFIIATKGIQGKSNINEVIFDTKVLCEGNAPDRAQLKIVKQFLCALSDNLGFHNVIEMMNEFVREYNPEENIN